MARIESSSHVYKMRNRQARSGNRLPPTLARPEGRSLAAAAVTAVLEEVEPLLLVLMETVELDPEPALAPVVGLGELVSELEPEPVADAVELGDCPELAVVSDIAVALEPLDPVSPEVAVAELNVGPDEAVLDAGTEVDEPRVLSLELSLVLPPVLLALEDVSVVDTEMAVSDVDEEELKMMTDPLVGLVCWAVVWSAGVEVISAKGEEVDVASVAGDALQ